MRQKQCYDRRLFILCCNEQSLCYSRLSLDIRQYLSDYGDMPITAGFRKWSSAWLQPIIVAHIGLLRLTEWICTGAKQNASGLRMIMRCRDVEGAVSILVPLIHISSISDKDLHNIMKPVFSCMI